MPARKTVYRQFKAQSVMSTARSGSAADIGSTTDANDLNGKGKVMTKAAAEEVPLDKCSGAAGVERIEKTPPPSLGKEKLTSAQELA